jgi:hypothetical protein
VHLPPRFGARRLAARNPRLTPWANPKFPLFLTPFSV